MEGSRAKPRRGRTKCVDCRKQQVLLLLHGERCVCSARGFAETRYWEGEDIGFRLLSRPPSPSVCTHFPGSRVSPSWTCMRQIQVVERFAFGNVATRPSLSSPASPLVSPRCRQPLSRRCERRLQHNAAGDEDPLCALGAHRYIVWTTASACHSARSSFARYRTWSFFLH